MTSNTPNPPPGCDNSGQWGTVTYAGEKTQCMCIVLCLLTGILSGCGACAYLCPSDEKDGYKIGNKIYDIRGALIGTAPQVTWRPWQTTTKPSKATATAARGRAQ